MNSTDGDVASLTWAKVLDALLPQRAVATFTKFRGAVELSRSWDAQIGAGVWSKAYRNGFELAAFNEWEFDVLRRLDQLKARHTYQALRLDRQGSVSSRHGSAVPQLVIKTIHAGPTLADLVHMPTMVAGELRAHAFVEPYRFLQLMRAILDALQSIHRLQFVHCDIHAGNIAIPLSDVASSGPSGAPSGVRGELAIDQLKLIDFGFSIDRQSPPPTTLPFMREGYGRQISPRFSTLLERIDDKARKQVAPGDRWTDVRFDPVFWRQLNPNPLGALCGIDWREDIFQVGMMLIDLREGRGEFDFLEGRLIETPAGSEAGRLIDGLPETMRLAGLGKAGESPHQGWIAAIDRVLDQMHRQGHGRHGWLLDVQNPGDELPRTGPQIIQKLETPRTIKPVRPKPEVSEKPPRPAVRPASRPSMADSELTWELDEPIDIEPVAPPPVWSAPVPAPAPRSRPPLGAGRRLLLTFVLLVGAILMICFLVNQNNEMRTGRADRRDGGLFANGTPLMGRPALEAWS